METAKGNDIQAYVAALYEIKYLTGLNTTEISKASAQIMTIVMFSSTLWVKNFGVLVIIIIMIIHFILRG